MCNFPSHRKTMLNAAATTKKPTSRTKLFLATWKGRISAMDPLTTAVMKPAAPNNSPTARLPLFVLIAANVEKTSGLPFPKARKVTPAMLSLKPSMVAMVLRLMQKKSLAAMPIVEKSSASHEIKMMNAIALRCGSLQ